MNYEKMSISELEIEKVNIQKEMILNAVQLALLKTFELDLEKIADINRNIEKEISRVNLFPAGIYGTKV